MRLTPPRIPSHEPEPAAEGLALTPLVFGAGAGVQNVVRNHQEVAPRALLDQAYQQLKPQLERFYGLQELNQVVLSVARYSHQVEPSVVPQGFFLRKDGKTLVIKYADRLTELNVAELAAGKQAKVSGACRPLEAFRSEDRQNKTDAQLHALGYQTVRSLDAKAQEAAAYAQKRFANNLAMFAGGPFVGAPMLLARKIGLNEHQVEEAGMLGLAALDVAVGGKVTRVARGPSGKFPQANALPGHDFDHLGKGGAKPRVGQTLEYDEKSAVWKIQGQQGEASSVGRISAVKTIAIRLPDSPSSNTKLVQKEEAVADVRSVTAKPVQADTALRVDTQSPKLQLKVPSLAPRVSTDRTALEALRTHQGYFDGGAQMFSTTLGQLMEKSDRGTRGLSDTKMNMTVLGTETGNYVLGRPRFADQTLLDNLRIAHLSPESAYEFATSLAREADKGRSPAAGSPGAALLQDIRQTTATVAKYKKEEMGNRLLNEEELNKALQQMIERHQLAIKKPLLSQTQQPFGPDVLGAGISPPLYSLAPRHGARSTFLPNALLFQVINHGREQALDFEKIRVADWMQSSYKYLNGAEEKMMVKALEMNGVGLMKNPAIHPREGNFLTLLNDERPRIEISDGNIFRGVVIHEIGHVNHFFSDPGDFVKKKAELSGFAEKYYHSIGMKLSISRHLLLSELDVRTQMEAIAVGNILNNASFLSGGFVDIENIDYIQRFLDARQALLGNPNLTFAQKKDIYKITSLSFIYDHMKVQGRINLKEDDFINRFVR